MSNHEQSVPQSTQLGGLSAEYSQFVPEDRLQAFVDHPENSVPTCYGDFYADTAGWTTDRRAHVKGELNSPDGRAFNVSAIVILPGALSKFVSKLRHRPARGQLHVTAIRKHDSEL